MFFVALRGIRTSLFIESAPHFAALRGPLRAITRLGASGQRFPTLTIWLGLLVSLHSGPDSILVTVLAGYEGRGAKFELRELVGPFCRPEGRPTCSTIVGRASARQMDSSLCQSRRRLCSPKPPIPLKREEPFLLSPSIFRPLSANPEADFRKSPGLFSASCGLRLLPPAEMPTRIMPVPPPVPWPTALTAE